MTRILVVMAGLVAVAAAFYWIGADRPLSDAAAGPEHGPIDATSRARLERVLRDAERNPGG